MKRIILAVIIIAVMAVNGWAVPDPAPNPFWSKVPGHEVDGDLTVTGDSAAAFSINDGLGSTTAVMDTTPGNAQTYMTLTNHYTVGNRRILTLKGAGNGGTPWLYFDYSGGTIDSPTTPTIGITSDAGGIMSEAWDGFEYDMLTQIVSSASAITGACTSGADCFLSGGFKMYAYDTTGISRAYWIFDDDGIIHISNAVAPGTESVNNQTGMKGGITIGQSDPPTSNPVNAFQLYSVDDGAGNATMSVWTENGSQFLWGKNRTSLMYDYNATAAVVGDFKTRKWEQHRALADDADGACETDGSDCMVLPAPPNSAALVRLISSGGVAEYFINGTGVIRTELEDYATKYEANTEAACTAGQLCLVDIADPANNVAIINNTGAGVDILVLMEFF